MAIMYFIAYAFIVLTIIIKPGGSLFTYLRCYHSQCLLKLSDVSRRMIHRLQVPAMAAAGKTNTFSVYYALGIYIGVHYLQAFNRK